MNRVDIVLPNGETVRVPESDPHYRAFAELLQTIKRLTEKRAA